MAKRSEFHCDQEIRQGGTNSKQHSFRSTCGVEGRRAVDQIVTCHKMQMDYYFKNCRSCDRMISDVLARLAEPCETLDEHLSLNLGRVKQGCAIRSPGTDLRVGRDGGVGAWYDEACWRQGH